MLTSKEYACYALVDQCGDDVRAQSEVAGEVAPTTEASEASTSQLDARVSLFVLAVGIALAATSLVNFI